MKKTKSQWEREFDEVFGTNLWREHRYKFEYKGEQPQWVSCAEEVKAFIRKFIK